MGEPQGFGAEIPTFQVQRSRYVYVPLRKLMDGVFADIHGSKPCTEKYKLTHEKTESGQFLGFKATMHIDCPSSLVPSGRINTTVLGACSYGNVQAEEDCMRKMVCTIYDQFKLFPADFSFIEIQRQRALFNAMKNVLEPARINYRELHTLMADTHEDLYRPCLKLSIWVGQSLNLVPESELAAVSRCYVKFCQHLEKFDAVMSHCRRLRDMLELMNVETEVVRRFEASVPVPTEINWQQSEHTLEVVFREAVKKFRGGTSKVDLYNFGVGDVRAVLEVAGTPYHFSSDLAANKEAALAKLYYKVVKYVHDEFGYSVLDFHHEACAYVKAYVDRFDHNMSTLIKCGEWLKLSFDDLFHGVEDSVAEMLDHIEICDATSMVFESIHSCGVILRAQKIYVESKWESLHGRLVTRANLEWQLANGH